MIDTHILHMIHTDTYQYLAFTAYPKMHRFETYLNSEHDIRKTLLEGLRNIFYQFLVSKLIMSMKAGTLIYAMGLPV